jgi:IS1 family transposase/transposase-like protein
MEPRPDLKSLCCVNPECKLSGKRDADNLTVRKTYGKAKIRYVRCRCCAEEFSERKGTALFNLKIPEAKAASIIEHLDSGCGVVATAQLVGVAKDTVSRLVRVSGRTSRALHDRFVRDLTPLALQFDEKWSYTGKKQQNLKEHDNPTQLGNHWDLNCMDPKTKLLVSVVVGLRTTETIHQVVADAASRLAPDTHKPAIFTDGEPAYKEAILKVFGHYYPAPRKTTRGRIPDPIIRVPHDLVYAQVIKHRLQGHLVKVEIHPVFGKGKLETVVQSLGWTKANTSAIERFNLTDRCRNRRKARKSLAFSKQTRCHDWMSWISAVCYNFVHTHRALRQKTIYGKWEHRTPAMAAGLVDHPYSTLELLLLCPFGLG